MSLKACIYKNCDSCNLHGVATPANITLFHFPKDSQRRQKWMEHGHVPASCPDSLLYMCSLHFEKKFISVTNRRTVLLGNAIPNVYDEDIVLNDEEDETNENIKNTEDNCEIGESSDIVLKVFPNEVDLVEEEYNFNEKHKFLIISKSGESEIHSSESEDLDAKVDSTVVNLNGKRKANSTMKTYAVKKCIGSSSSSAASTTSKTVCQTTINTKKNSSNYNIDNCEWENVIDPTQVATFLFKGEDYVQMPKDYYVNEKTNLLRKIFALESKLEIIKDSVNTILDNND